MLPKTLSLKKNFFYIMTWGINCDEKGKLVRSSSQSFLLRKSQGIFFRNKLNLILGVTLQSGSIGVQLCAGTALRIF